MDKQVTLEATQEIELPRLDLSQYVGKKARIIDVAEFEGEYKGKKSYYVRVICSPVDVIGTGDNTKELRPSKLFGLQVDAVGRVGWGKKTQLGVFLESKGVKHYRDLVGREVTVQIVTRMGKEYLSFI